ncbi:MAG: hypothetical protein MHM6MM_008679 [Cercozoa sp. M6MM]
MTNVLLGYEQANKYTLFDSSQQCIGYIVEESSGFWSAVKRNVLRTHRATRAKVLSPSGEHVFTVRRDLHLMSSTTVVETPEGQEFGRIEMDWHLWRRRYNLYLGDTHFGRVDGGFLDWSFAARDAKSDTLAVVDRNFAGWGRELLADAGKYAIHFRDVQVSDNAEVQHEMKRHLLLDTGVQVDKKNDTKADSVATTRTVPATRTSEQQDPFAGLTLQNDAPIVSVASEQIRGRPLLLDERAVLLALAISVDFDYYSRKDGGLMPMFIPIPGASTDEVAEDGVAVGVGTAAAGAASAGVSGAASDLDYSLQESPAASPTDDATAAAAQGSDGQFWSQDDMNSGSNNGSGDGFWSDADMDGEREGLTEGAAESLGESLGDAVEGGSSMFGMLGDFVSTVGDFVDP